MKFFCFTAASATAYSICAILMSFIDGMVAGEGDAGSLTGATAGSDGSAQDEQIISPAMR